MPRRHVISDEEVRAIEKARQKNKDKTVDRWLYVLVLHAAGEKRRSISEKTGFHPQYITVLVGGYARGGLDALTKKGYKGNHRNMSYAEETQFLEAFMEQADAGQVVETSAIKAAYEKKVGHPIGKGQIYQFLKRHGWRKVKPRSRHPKKASEEACEATKKLTSA